MPTHSNTLQPSPPRDSPLRELIEAATDFEYEERLSFVDLLQMLESDETLAALFDPFVAGGDVPPTATDTAVGNSQLDV